MEQLRGLGWLPDIPSHLDYTEDHAQVAPNQRIAKFNHGERGR